MWLLFWKKYSLSKGATFVSIIGALMRYASVMCISYSTIVGFVVCAAIGVALHFLAEYIGNSKWQKVVIEKGFAAKIAAGDLETAISVYKSNPSKSALKFIASQNAQMAEEISTQIKKK